MSEEREALGAEGVQGRSSPGRLLALGAVALGLLIVGVASVLQVFGNQIAVSIADLDTEITFSAEFGSKAPVELMVQEN